jgi:MoaA/NifB/PqqE/SkfB family radical SAM enzyme
MILKRAAAIAAAFWKIRVLKKRIPYFAAWNLTFRCNLNCMYCGVNDVRIPEWSTRQILQGLDQLWELGTRWITFGGGEPLLREDVGEVFDYAKRKGFQVYLSTNGSLASRRAEQVRGVDHVNLSLDGEREVHDRIRGKGAFDNAVKALEAFQGVGVPVSLLCVLSKHNLDQAEKVIGIAAEHGVRAMFQPAERLLHTSRAPNPICPPVDDYRRTISRLLELKKQGAAIRNSAAGLKHLARWPDPCRLRCPAGALVSVIEPDGTMVACHLLQYDAGKLSNSKPLAVQFQTMPTPTDCEQCWCAPLVELSLLLSLRPEPLLNAFRVLRG